MDSKGHFVSHHGDGPNHHDPHENIGGRRWGGNDTIRENYGSNTDKRHASSSWRSGSANHHDERGWENNKSGSRGDVDSPGREDADLKRPAEDQNTVALPKKLKTGLLAEPSASVNTSSKAEPLVLVTSDDYKREYVSSLIDTCKCLPSNKAFQMKKGCNELAQRQIAARKALQELETLTVDPPQRKASAMYDSESSSDGGFSDCDDAGKKVLTREHRQFILALPSCIPIDTGFNILPLREGDDRVCFCPCGPCLKPWIQKHKLVMDNNCNGRYFVSNDLMDHLKSEGGGYKTKREYVSLKDIHHHGTWLYLKHLYADWHNKDIPGLGHKALYPRLSGPYKKAENEERRIQEVEKKKLQLEVKEKDEENERLKSLSNDQYAKIKQLESEMGKLNIQKKENITLSVKEIVKYKKMAMCYFKARKKDIAGSKKLKISVPGRPVETELLGDSSGFSLQHFFDSTYVKKGGDTRALLFGDDNGGIRITKLILSDWEIVYEKAESYGHSKDAKAQKKLDTGKDEGGPSRQFLADIWKQVESLSIQVGGDQILLFVNTPHGIIPSIDEDIHDNIAKAAKKCSVSQAEMNEAISRARHYSRAIGRIMLHALSNEQTLPSDAMPPFFVTVLFHGYDDDYYRGDVLKHTDIFFPNSRLTFSWLLDGDDEGNKWTKDTIFTEWIPMNYIRSRELLLGGLIDGLTFGGKPNASKSELEKGCGLSDLLSVVPLEAIQRIWFSKPKVTLQDVLEVIKPDYKLSSDEFWEGNEKEGQLIKEKQRKFFEGSFKRYLEETTAQDSTFLRKFVQCATGLNYLPYDLCNNEDTSGGKFEIKIEFLYCWDVDGSYPTFHTCDKTVVIPKCIFLGDYETFCEKMTRAIEESYTRFNQQ